MTFTESHRIKSRKAEVPRQIDLTSTLFLCVSSIFPTLSLLFFNTHWNPVYLVLFCILPLVLCVKSYTGLCCRICMLQWLSVIVQHVLWMSFEHLPGPPFLTLSYLVWNCIFVISIFFFTPDVYPTSILFSFVSSVSSMCSQNSWSMGDKQPNG